MIMVLQILQEKFAAEILQTIEGKDGPIAILRKDRVHDILKFLKEDPELSFDILMDLFGVDYLLSGEKPRFEIVYQLYSMKNNLRLRLRTKVAEEDMTLPTAIDLWKAADWFEREAYDMFGFKFEGHPNLKRLLLFEGFEGHALRKDYPITKRQKIPVPQERVG